MARTLADPILRDANRVIYNSHDISAEFKTRVMNGLDAIDRELADLRELVAPETPKAKKR